MCNIVNSSWDSHPRKAYSSPCNVQGSQSGDMNCVLALSTLRVWISCSCKPSARWEIWRATVSAWKHHKKPTACIPGTPRWNLASVAICSIFFLFLQCHFLCITNLSQTQYCLLAQTLLSITKFHAIFPIFFRISVKIAFALFASTGDYRTCGHDKNFPTLQIVKDNQTLASGRGAEKQRFLDKPAGRALAQSTGWNSQEPCFTAITLSFFMPLGTQEYNSHCQIMVCSTFFGPDMTGTAWAK